jgi:N-acetylglucosaminyl-diphospho-decaprenol L-rhamnosyltransferase
MGCLVLGIFLDVVESSGNFTPPHHPRQKKEDDPLLRRARGCGSAFSAKDAPLSLKNHAAQEDRLRGACKTAMKTAMFSAKDQGGMTTAAEVTIVAVTFNSTPVLEPMLQSVPAGTLVMLVDNASDDAAQLVHLAGAYGARIIQNTQNIGFGAACNQGAAIARTEFLLFLNPDARLDLGALDLLIGAARQYPAASAFNPALIDDDGHVRFKRHSDLLPGKKMARGLPKAEGEVTVLVGAALLVRREAFEKVGGFDEKIFLYYEDDDISLRLSQSCGPLMVIPAAVVRHARGASSGAGTDVSTFKSWHLGQARVYALRKHGIPFARVRSVVTALRKLTNPVILWRAGEARARLAFLRGVLAGSAQTQSYQKEPS